MYYIAKNQFGIKSWARVKRLRDFKPEQGSEYVVAKTWKAIQGDSGLISIYVEANGKLEKTDRYKMFFHH
jgi:hypothetical protein